MNNNLLAEIEGLTLLQKKAVEWNEGPLAVIAGPGSGKTTVLTLRIAKLLSESSNESYRVLGLTFTNKAADEMRNRVHRILPDEKNRLFLGTFHGFCASVLRNHGSYIDVSPNFTIYSDSSDLKEILKEVLLEAEVESNRSMYTGNNYLSVIQYLLRNLIDPNETLEDVVTDHELRNNIAKIYKGYWQKLEESNALDFDTLIFKTFLLFNKFPFVAKHYRTIFPYVCVDEFQDTNYAQYSLIKSLLGDKNKNIFIVADDDQVIYQWNGASNKRLNEFRNEFNPDIIQLTDNFRCPKSIVSLANNLISHNKGRLLDKKPSRSAKEKEIECESNVVRVREFFSLSEEVEWIATDIKSKARFSSTAVIARSNKLLNKAFEQLKTQEIKCSIIKRKNQFESPQIYFLHTLLRLANKRNDEKFLGEVISTFEYINRLSENLDKEAIIAWCESNDGDYLKGFYNAIKDKGYDEKFINALQLELVENKDFFGFVKSAFEWFETISKMEEDNEELKELYSEEKETWDKFIGNLHYKYGTEVVLLSTFLQELDMISKHRDLEDGTCVECLTIHSAKGKEFNHVYLLGVVEDELPSFMSKKQGEESIEEERRNCFVAITRSIETLTLTYSNMYNGWQKSPSRFLKEMGVL
ncbi:ATP-dependent helicase [Paenibacillus barcinonensis]|uniref:DNA 3'-5' helicase n=1 Tax=Paenibacillus barcinonensis TaxID=198119 RepID=A0A2V4W419_PAEBA|nr:ATP-dependent helicase [Paenibacillus barcinonensis]PYE49276.1 DNA helicase-2/ATP-dependent DNA helicase PcrA [Paenibacillus barcinonensis]QKS55499.1 ATP-dependent helicase [Paenibacillus barcinonensis]